MLFRSHPPRCEPCRLQRVLEILHRNYAVRGGVLEDSAEGERVLLQVGDQLNHFHGRGCTHLLLQHVVVFLDLLRALLSKRGVSLGLRESEVEFAEGDLPWCLLGQVVKQEADILVLEQSPRLSEVRCLG